MEIFDDIIAWLNEEALSEHSFDVTIKSLGDRLREGGVPVARINVGRMMLHPAIGLFDSDWHADTGLVRTSVVDRSQVSPTLGADSPFGDMSKRDVFTLMASFDNPEERAQYALFEQLYEQGYTGYAAFGRRFGQKQHIFEGVTEDFRGTFMSFATRRAGGFTAKESAGLERLATPVAVTLRVATERFLTVELLSHYLGQATGEKVYAGYSARGEGERIDCVLFYSDMRNSLGIADRLEPEDYLAVVNRFFDCTAAAVLDHGGEVLKFIGDGVLAIFPVIAGRRPKQIMCRAALAAARDAIQRAARQNAERPADTPEVRFGIALHVGEVIYGNVGTVKRHDFTATGRAVGLAARLEGLSTELGAHILATEEFATACGEPNTDLGAHQIKGFDAPVPIVGYAPTP